MRCRATPPRCRCWPTSPANGGSTSASKSRPTRVTSLLLDLEGNVVDRLVTDAGGAAAGEALAMVDRWTASAGLPSSTFVAGPFAPGARATDGTAGLVTNVEGDAVRG